jgi:hypothetical protein
VGHGKYVYCTSHKQSRQAAKLFRQEWPVRCCRGMIARTMVHSTRVQVVDTIPVGPKKNGRFIFFLPGQRQKRLLALSRRLPSDRCSVPLPCREEESPAH